MSCPGIPGPSGETTPSLTEAGLKSGATTLRVVSDLDRALSLSPGSVREPLRGFWLASEMSQGVLWMRKIDADPMVVTPSRSESSFRSYRAFSFSSSRAPTRLPVGVGGVETGFLEAGDRKESFGPIPVEIGSTVPKLCAWTRRRQIFFLQLPASFSPSP